MFHGKFHITTVDRWIVEEIYLFLALNNVEEERKDEEKEIPFI